ncbi:uncharacterized protein B0T15DRAFT_512237 [Chaetomium strumarium]|uniref:C2H2-type domain-containing protein n=1 Tax=Chaetomium strumarium TaxID=1170767 RepID=A0AAJ0GQ17_9PEZI|nr:hypothetical protein B0T15DRAFT_512237 [Chaetomium strumarium]
MCLKGTYLALFGTKQPPVLAYDPLPGAQHLATHDPPDPEKNQVGSAYWAPKQGRYFWEEPGCSAKYTSMGALNVHIAKVHRGIRHRCSHCGKRFSTIGALRTHIKSATTRFGTLDPIVKRRSH